jgi:hypothetical protein
MANFAPLIRDGGARMVVARLQGAVFLAPLRTIDAMIVLEPSAAIRAQLDNAAHHAEKGLA